MLLPDKHVRIAESIFGLAALVLATLDRPQTVDRTPAWPAFHTAETVSLALCFLYSVGAVEVSDDGELARCG